MDNERHIPFTRHDLFATPVLLFELQQAAMNQRLRAFFKTHDRFARADQAEMSDHRDLMEHVDEEPAPAQLDALFLDGLRIYRREIGWRGEFEPAYQLFPNVAPKGHYVPSHNHVSHISAVCYVHTETVDRSLLVSDETVLQYWRPDQGALILHDPHFNASLCGGWHYHAKVFPRPGVMVFFPSFLWHEVTPHVADQPRLSVAANLFLTYRNIPPYERRRSFTS